MNLDARYPDVHVQLTSTDGNAFAIMGAVRTALRRADVPKDDLDAFMAEAMAGDYNALLRTVMMWVDVS